jgi:hypothetical protein
MVTLMVHPEWFAPIGRLARPPVAAKVVALNR